MHSPIQVPGRMCINVPREMYQNVAYHVPSMRELMVICYASGSGKTKKLFFPHIRLKVWKCLQYFTLLLCDFASATFMLRFFLCLLFQSTLAVWVKWPYHSSTPLLANKSERHYGSVCRQDPRYEGGQVYHCLHECGLNFTVEVLYHPMVWPDNSYLVLYTPNSISAFPCLSTSSWQKHSQ